MGANGERHLRAGEFGAVTGLSAKALRLYAEQGLLVPADIDPATGYRRYTPEQIPRARLIARLRALGLPLARIGHLADLTPEARALDLRGWLRTQRALLDERAVVVESVQQVPDPVLLGAIRLRDVPATKVLCRSRQIDSHLLADFTARAERDIRAHLRASGLADDGPRYVTFEGLVTPDSENRVEAAVACTGAVEPVGDLYLRLMPARTEAYLPVPPTHEELPLILRVYDAIEAWTDARPGIACCGHSYEITPGTGARFDVAYPVTT